MSSITLNSNLASLNAQRRLASSSRDLGSSFVRLSSGLRINRAADDAAGLSISESLKADERVLGQGIRNLNDGISLLSIADAAVAELSSITIRLSELAEQSATGSLSNVQRKALDEEGQALKEEYFRIVQTTEFNGEKLFDGNLGELRLQAGYGSNGGISSGLGGAIGNGALEDPIITGLGDGLNDVASADLNGDGIVDIVVADAVDDAFFILFGDGEGSFNESQTLDIGSSPGSIELVDTNGDGNLDILAIDSNTDVIYSSLNTGDGSFSSPSIVVTDFNQVVGMATGDFNSDGILDIAAADSNDNRLKLFLGTGNGEFTAGESIVPSNGIRSVFVNDQNGDGQDDIIIGGNTNAEVFLLDGSGGVSNQISTSAKSQIGTVSTGDFNDDGILDLFVVSGPADDAEVFIGKNDGSFDVNSFVGSQLGAIAAGDFNGDGNDDLAYRDGNSSVLRVRISEGDGNFLPVSEDTFETSYDGAPLATITDDFNGDGVVDLLVTDAGDDEVEVRLGSTEDGIAPLLDFSLGTQAGARQALPVFRNKLNQLAQQRGQIGAYEARLGAALATTRTTKENYTAAASQITDADVAVEAARLVRQQILQQAGISVLSQANQAPALALALLG